MKPRFTKPLSLALAGILQLAPVIRTVLPVATPTAALILRWIAGGVAFMGYDAISSASSLSAPPPATIGSPYSATIAYNGGHSGTVNSMSMSNNCLGTAVTLAPGLTIKYNSGYTAVISGTPTGSLATVPITLEVFASSSCGSGEHDTRATSLVIQNSSGGPAVPSFAAAPQSVISQVGVDVLLSGTATGNPTPQYFWKQGINAIPGATNSSLTISNAQLSNSGVYTLVASNSQGTAVAACYVTMAVTPSSLSYLYTNYIIAGTPVTMMSLITNVSTASNSYQWQYNANPSGLPATSNLTLSGSQTVPLKSGTYTIGLSSVVSGNYVVSNQYYDSYWQFGFVPVVTNQPSPVSAPLGSNATFNVTLSGSSYPTLLWYQNATNLVAVQTALTNSYNPTTVSATTNVSLTISNVSAANAGNYTVVVTNFWGSTTSSVAALTVTGGVPTVSSPAGVTNYVGKTVSFTVTGSGTGPLSYQWQKNTVNLANGGTITGATTNTLSIAPAATTDSGSYRVVVTNSSGSVTSSVAPLSIIQVPPVALSVLGNASLSASGAIPGSSYILQFSTNVLSSNAWVSLKTNTVPGGGIISLTDTNPATLPQGYYRLLFP